MMTKANLLFKKAEDRPESRLIEDIHSTLREMDAAYSRFEIATDNDLMDAAIYEIKALDAKYRYLLRLAKENPQLSKQEDIT